MKSIQILTLESILKIERAILFLEIYNDFIPDVNTPEVIEDLKKIIQQVKE